MADTTSITIPVPKKAKKQVDDYSSQEGRLKKSVWAEIIKRGMDALLGGDKNRN